MLLTAQRLKEVVEELRRVIARAKARPRLQVRPEGRRRTSVLQEALGPRAPFRASNKSKSGLFKGFFSVLPCGETGTAGWRKITP